MFKLYRVTLVQPANATRRRRSMVCAERADVERLIIRGPTEFISSAEVGGPIDNFIANLLANRMPSAKTRESFYGLLKTYIGRYRLLVIDKLILFANQIHGEFPLDQILLIGREVNTPFRTHDIRKYVLRSHLHKKLAEVVRFGGFLKQKPTSMLASGAISPGLGSANLQLRFHWTRSGNLPVVRRGTPMAEFFPAGECKSTCLTRNSQISRHASYV